MSKRSLFILVSLFLLPSLAHADRLGSLKSNADVLLSSQATSGSGMTPNATYYAQIDPTGTQSGAINISSITIRNNFRFTDSDSIQSLSFTHSVLPRSFGFGPQVVDTDIYARTFENSGYSGGFSLTASTEAAIVNLGLSYSRMTIYGPSTNVASHISLEAHANGSPPANGGDSAFINVYPTSIQFFRGSFPVMTFSSGTIDFNYNGILNPGYVTGDLVTSDTIGSDTGNFNFGGTTVTIAAPAIDVSDRVPILNNGALTWPLAVTDGAQKGSNNVFTSTSGNSFTYGITVGSITVNDLTASALVKTDSNKKLSSVSNSSPDGTKFLRDDLTFATPAGAGGWTATATSNLNMSTFSIANVSSMSYAGGEGWIERPSTHSACNSSFAIVATSSFTIPSIQFMTVANATYSYVADIVWASASTNAAGAKFAVTGPSDASQVRMVLGGAGASATTANFSQSASAFATLNGTAMGTASSQTWSIHMFGNIVTGPSGGPINFQIVMMSGAGSNNIREGTQLTAWRE